MTIVQISFGVVHQYLQPQEGIYHCTRKAESNFPADIRLPINMSKSATEKDISTEEYPLEKKNYTYVSSIFQHKSTLLM